MDTTQILGFSIGCASLIGTALGVAKSLYEIRKFKEEIKTLQSTKGEPKVYLPTLSEILKIQGDAEKYRKSLEDQQTHRERERKPEQEEKTNKLYSFSYYGSDDWEGYAFLAALVAVFVPIIYILFSLETVRFPLPAGCKLPLSVLKGLNSSFKRLRVFALAMVIILLTLLVILILWGLPLCYPNAFFYSNAKLGLIVFLLVFFGFLPASLYVFSLIRILGLAHKNKNSNTIITPKEIASHRE